MGKTNSKIPITLTRDRYPSIHAPYEPQRDSYLKRIYASEKKMIIYNCCPKNLNKSKVSKRFSRLIKKRRYHIKSVYLDSKALSSSNSELLRVLSRLKSLNTLEIEYWGNAGITFKTFSFFSKSLIPLKYLKACSVQNHDPDVVSLKGSALILYRLSLLQKIKQVNLAFTHWMHNNASEEAIKNFLSKTTRLWRAERFAFDISSCEHLTDPALAFLAKKLGKFSFLKELRFDLRDVECLGQIGIKVFLENLTKLKLILLELKFGGHKTICDEELDKISQNLRKIETLQSLGLTFEGYKNIQLKGIESLVEGINYLKKLRHLAIDLPGCSGLMDFEMISFSKNIAVFEKLTHLRLDLYLCSISDIGIIHLGQSFRRLENIRGLSLLFGGHENFMDHALISLGQALGLLKKLTTFQFKFAKTKITDAGLDKFSEELAKLKALNQLEIDFTMNQKITGRGVAALGEGLVKLTELTELILDFSHSTAITGEGVVGLTLNLSGMKNLSQVKLRFQNCMKINKAAQDALKAFES